jgi:hypothetical protein
MEGDVITMQDIFMFERRGIGEGDKVLGPVQPPASWPKFADRLKTYGIDLGAMLFSNLNERPHTASRTREPGGRSADHDLGDRALVFLAVALGTISSLADRMGQERRRQREAVRQLRAFANEDPEQAGLLAREGGMPRWLMPIAARVPALQDLELMMEQAGLKGHLAAFLLGMIGLSVGLGLATLIFTRMLPAAVLAAVIGGMLPYMVVRQRRTSGSTPSRSSFPRRSTSWAGPFARVTRSRRG